jgi:hypothetical protein
MPIEAARALSSLIGVMSDGSLGAGVGGVEYFERESTD